MGLTILDLEGGASGASSELGGTSGPYTHLVVRVGNAPGSPYRTTESDECQVQTTGSQHPGKNTSIHPRLT